MLELGIEGNARDKGGFYFFSLNYYRSDVTIFVVCRLLISAPLLLVCWLAHRQISAAPVLSPRSCRVGSHIRLTFSLACPYMTTEPCGV